MVRLHTENQLHSLPGSASKVCVVGGGGGWWVESKFNDRLWLSSSLALAKPNNCQLDLSLAIKPPHQIGGGWYTCLLDN